jgi:hypothetical protein
MSSRIKGGPGSSVSVGDTASLAENSKQLLQTLLKSIHEHTWRSCCHGTLAKKSIPGCLSFLLGIAEADLVEKS